MTAASLRVYVSGPAFHIRPSNTDWQYLRLLTRLPEFAPELTVIRESPAWPTLAYNLRYCIGVPAFRLGLERLRWAVHVGLESKLPRADLLRSGSDLVYAYGDCPVNAAPVPLVLHRGAIDPAMALWSGPNESLAQGRIAALKAETRRLAAKATLLTANSQTALDNLVGFMPEMQPRMRVLPFFLPHLQAIDPAAIATKFREPGPLRLVFVGRQARRKGLTELLAAFPALDAALPGQLHLTVVSSLSDGQIPLPQMPNLTHIRELGRDEVQQLLRRSHMVLMPSRYESYGWVYLEAMAAGSIPVASEAPIQREILAGGLAGVLAAPDAAKLEAALLPLLSDRQAMEAMALRAWEHCHRNYLPHPVAARMSEVFAEAKELGRPPR